jgi:hypothetical protein
MLSLLTEGPHSHKFFACGKTHLENLEISVQLVSQGLILLGFSGDSSDQLGWHLKNGDGREDGGQRQEELAFTVEAM